MPNIDTSPFIGWKRENQLKPFIRWRGGKQPVISNLEEYCPDDFENYYEPFVGAGSLLFTLKRKAIIGDINKSLIDVYKGISNNVGKVEQELNMYKDKNNQEDYDKIKEMYNSPEFDTMLLEERAALFIYLINTSYGSKYRVNSEGDFNNTYWKKPKGKFLPNFLLLDEISKYLKENVEILCGDFEKTVVGCKENDFVYFDPPYYNDGEKYDINNFTTEDHKRLKRVMDKLDKEGCKVLITNKDCPQTREIFSTYTILPLESKCRIDSKNKSIEEIPMKEIIIKNY